MIASVTAGGAYDGEPTCAAAAARQRHPPPDVVVLPRASALPSSDQGDGNAQSPRDRHIQIVEPRGPPDKAERGRIGWQKATVYGRRNQAETAMARYKHLIGPKLHARSLPAQQGEVAIAIAIAVAVLNTMIPGKARLHPGRLDSAREGPAQPRAGPYSNATRHRNNAIVARSLRVRRRSSHRPHSSRCGDKDANRARIKAGSTSTSDYGIHPATGVPTTN